MPKQITSQRANYLLLQGKVIMAQKMGQGR